MMNVVETERLALRPFEENDLRAFASVYSDPDVMRFSNILSYSQAEKKLQDEMSKFKKQGFGMMAWIDMTNSHFIGTAELYKETVDGEEVMAFSYTLAKKAWGQGYPVELGQGILDYAFGKLALKKLTAVVDPRNLDGVNVAKKMGMRFIRNTVVNGFSVQFYSMDKPRK